MNINHHFVFRGSLINGIQPFYAAAVFALPAVSGSALSVPEVYFKSHYTVARPFGKYVVEHYRRAVAEQAESMRPSNQFDAFRLGIIGKFHDCRIGISAVPAAVEQIVFPAHFGRKINITVMRSCFGKIILFNSFSAYLKRRFLQPAPCRQSGINPFVIVNRLFRVGKAVVVIGFPVFGVVVHFFDHFGFNYFFERTHRTDTPGRCERIFYNIVIFLNTSRAYNGLQNSRLEIFFAFFKERTVKTAAYKAGFGNKRISFGFACSVRHRHGNVFSVKPV